MYLVMNWLQSLNKTFDFDFDLLPVGLSIWMSTLGLVDFVFDSRPVCFVSFGCFELIFVHPFMLFYLLLVS